MPVVFRSRRKTADLSSPDPEAVSPSGVISYEWNSQEGSLYGTFVLALYGGEVAVETGAKRSGSPGELAGDYDITTFTPTGDVFATGTLVIVPMGSAGAFDVTFILLPEDLAALGYIDGTVLTYKAIGMQTSATQLVVAWDNDVYTCLLYTSPSPRD